MSIINIYMAAHSVEMSKTFVVGLFLSDTEPVVRCLGWSLGGSGGSHAICDGTACQRFRLRFFGETCNVGLRRVEVRSGVTAIRKG